MSNIRKNISRFKRSDEGVVGIVVAVMLIGLFVTAIAFVQTVYVPRWMQQKESEHMGEVANQFAQLKFSIDTLSALAQPNNQISTPITLGSDEMPFLNTIRSYGSLNVMPNDYKLKIEDKYNNTYSYKLGAIEYTSSNSYYLEQSYVFENGALILSQSDSDLLIADPLISVIGSDELSFQIIKLSGLGDRTSASGYGTYPVQTKYYSSEKLVIYDVANITIYTNYKYAWQSFFDDILSGSSLAYSFSDTADGKGMVIAFSDSADSDYPTLTLSVVEIKIQISAGWLE